LCYLNLSFVLGNGEGRWVYELTFKFYRMTLQLLSNITDTLYHKHSGVLVEREDYHFVKTETRPSFFWGNYLIMRHAPGLGDYERWRSLYEQEFDSKQQGFMTFTWDEDAQGETADFVENGFDLTVNNVLCLNKLLAPTWFNDVVDIRPLASDWDWAQYVEVHPLEGPATLEFVQNEIREHREFIEKGISVRYGAFMGEQLVADLGILHENGIGRFNNVGTHLDYRRQGICRTLVYAVSQKMKEHNLNKLVIVAEQDSIAERIYKSLGYEVVETSYELTWYHRERFRG